jgi:hypothetical protein
MIDSLIVVACWKACENGSMTNVRGWQVDALTDRPICGNPAAICWLEDDVDSGWMQSVAAEMNLSETGFVRDGIWAESFLEDRRRRSLRENCSVERDRVECASWADAPTC